jgi:hypothetical protein
MACDGAYDGDTMRTRQLDAGYKVRDEVTHGRHACMYTGHTVRSAAAIVLARLSLDPGVRLSQLTGILCPSLRLDDVLLQVQLETDYKCLLTCTAYVELITLINLSNLDPPLPVLYNISSASVTCTFFHQFPLPILQGGDILQYYCYI